MQLATEVMTLLKGSQYYLDKEVDPFHLSHVICSEKSDNKISIARYKGELSAIHIVVSEYPS
jgi:hypothetical protein